MGVDVPSRALVVGSTGRLGQRCVRELLRTGVSVRAVFREGSEAKAEALFSDPSFTKAKGKLERVACDLEDEAAIREAARGCGAVVCALGALETDLTAWRAPYLVDGQMTQRVIRAAKDSNSVRHFILVTSLGTGTFGLPASLLNLFFGVLSWKRQSEKALIKSGLPFTIIRPGGMEKPTDDYQLTHNVRLLPEDMAFGGQVSRLQVAQLAAAAVCHPSEAAGKIVEVVAETEAPKVPLPQLLAELPASGQGNGGGGDTKAGNGGKTRLSPMQYYVLRMGGTELAYTSPLNGEKRPGVFACASCGQPLFPSETKYESNTGWPSFYAPVSDAAVDLSDDFSMLAKRTEVRCSNCGGHLGHSFPDGPRPTNTRFCINGAALAFLGQEKAQQASGGGSGDWQQQQQAAAAGAREPLKSK